jgi:hypothetical protein
MTFKRLFVATGIFGCMIFLLLLPGLIQVFAMFWDSGAGASSIGIHIEFGSPIRILAASSVLALLALLAYGFQENWSKH